MNPASLDEQLLEAKQAVAALGQQVAELDSVPPEQIEATAKRVDRNVGKIRTNLDSLKLEIKTADLEERHRFTKELHKLQADLRGHRSALDWKRKAGQRHAVLGSEANRPSLADPGGPVLPEDLEALTTEQQIDAGDRAQQRTKASAGRAARAAAEAEVIGNKTLVRMNEQEEQLGRVDKRVDDVTDIMDSNKAIMKMVAKEAAKDPITRVMGIMFLISLALLLVVIGVAVGMGKLTGKR